MSERDTERVLKKKKRERGRKRQKSEANLSNLLLAFIINRDFPFIGNPGRTCNAL